MKKLFSILPVFLLLAGCAVSIAGVWLIWMPAGLIAAGAALAALGLITIKGRTNV